MTRRVTSKQRPERTAEPNGCKSRKEKEKKKEKKQALLEVALGGPRSTGHNGSSSSVGFGQQNGLGRDAERILGSNCRRRRATAAEAAGQSQKAEAGKRRRPRSRIWEERNQGAKYQDRPDISHAVKNLSILRSFQISVKCLVGRKCRANW